MTTAEEKPAAPFPLRMGILVGAALAILLGILAAQRCADEADVETTGTPKMNNTIQSLVGPSK